MNPESIPSRRPLVAPSLLACNFLEVGAQLEAVEAAGADWLHLDVMDGHFVDNLSFGPAFCAAVAKRSGIPLDVHLMVSRPDRYFDRFTEFASVITVHVESDHDVADTLARIRQAGCCAGLTLNPDTPFDLLTPHLGSIDLLLVMTVVPGFGGQAFLPAMLEKVRQAASLRSASRLKFLIEVDGGVDRTTAADCRKAGADVLVAGSAVFGAADMVAAIRQIRG